MPDLDVWWGIRTAARHLECSVWRARQAITQGDVAEARLFPSRIGWRAPARCWQRWWRVTGEAIRDVWREREGG